MPKAVRPSIKAGAKIVLLSKNGYALFEFLIKNYPGK